MEELFDLFRYAFVEICERELDRSARELKGRSEIKVQVAIPDNKSILCTLPNFTSIREKILELIKKAEKNLLISTFGIEKDHIVFQELKNALQRGIAVDFFTRTRPVLMPALLDLLEHGAKIYGHRFLHAKAIICDQNDGLIMTSNLQKHGLDEGYEIAVILSKSQLQDLQKIFTFWRNHFPWRLEKNIKISEISSNQKILVWEKNNAKTFKTVTVKDEEVIDYKKLTIRSLIDIEKKPELSHEENLLAHQYLHIWKISLPFLPKKSELICQKKKRNIPFHYIERKDKNMLL